MLGLRYFVALFFVLTCGFNVCAGESKPNVLLVLADDLGYSDLGC